MHLMRDRGLVGVVPSGPIGAAGQTRIGTVFISAPHICGLAGNSVAKWETYAVAMI